MGSKSPSSSSPSPSSSPVLSRFPDLDIIPPNSGLWNRQTPGQMSYLAKWSSYVPLPDCNHFVNTFFCSPQHSRYKTAHIIYRIRWIICTCLHNCAVSISLKSSTIVFLVLFWSAFNLLFLPEASRQRYIPSNGRCEAGSIEDD